jgi:hypothetical protein
MTVKRARDILGDQIADMADEEVIEIDRLLSRIAGIAIDYAEKKISSKYCK